MVGAIALLPLFASVAVAFSRSQTAGANRLDSQLFVPNTYIVEVDGQVSGLAKRGLSAKALLSNVLGQIKLAGINLDIKHEFNALPEAFHGASIKVDASVSAQDLLKVDGVSRVWPVAIHKRPKDPTPLDDLVELAEKVLAGDLLHPNWWSSSTKGDKRYKNDGFGAHAQSGVAGAHNDGVLGKGVKIAILDDGVDYKNPILGGCFGKGCQISFGYDFVGDDYDGTGSPAPDDDPYTECSDHGTHVTGTVAALPNAYGFTGVSPSATIGHYRVMSCYGATSDDILIDALMTAVSEGVDVVSISIGGSVGWLDVTPTQVVIDYLTETKGINVVVAMGNDGSEGLFFSEAPATTRNAISVGSVDVSYLPTYQANIKSNSPIAYMSPTPLGATGTYNVYFTSNDSSLATDACSALPANTPNLANSVVVVQRGTCTYTVKYKNIAAAGGKVVLLYNSADALMLPQLNVGTSGISAVGGLTREAGLKLLSLYTSSTKPLQMTFPNASMVAADSGIVGVADDYSGGLISTFSSFGPTNELYGQPSLAAPGQNILSTVPLASGGVSIMRGTSMACPYAAGAAALLLGARPSYKLTPLQLRSILMTTASWIPTEFKGKTYATVARQGGGLIDMTAALAATSLLAPHEFLLNDTAYLNGTQTLTITNKALFPVKYTFSSTAVQALGTYDNSASEDVLVSSSPLPVNAAASVSFSSQTLTVAAGKSKSITVTIKPPQLSAADTAKFPIYSGFINVAGVSQGLLGLGLVLAGKKESYTVPYFGLAAAMVDMPILDTTDVVLGANYPFIANGDDILTDVGAYTQAEGVTIYFRLAGGSRRVNLDLVDGDLDFSSTIPSNTNARRRKRVKRTLFESATSPNSLHGSLETRARALYSDVTPIGNIYSPFIPARDYFNNFASIGGPAPFSDYELPFTGSYTSTDGSTASVQLNKTYRVLLRALKITADPLYEDSYESWLSPPFSFTA